MIVDRRVNDFDISARNRVETELSALRACDKSVGVVLANRRQDAGAANSLTVTRQALRKLPLRFLHFCLWVLGADRPASNPISTLIVEATLYGSEESSLRLAFEVRRHN